MSGEAPGSGSAAGSVLVLGVYLCDRENHATHIVGELGRSARWRVEQRWIALGRSQPPEALRTVTAWRAEAPQGKFLLMNRLLREADLGRHDYLLVCDDDITLPAGFIDRYLELVARHDLALAQPARSHDSYIDHWFVEQLDGLDARRTRFVEIGPLFSMRRDAVRLLTPFGEASPMGWGYDFVWPVELERAGLKMGIVDATPVVHTLRKPVALYDRRDAGLAMKAFLAERDHLPLHDAFSIVEAYS